MSQLTTGDVAGYYDGKTQAILRRYRPGPRVHYHTGLIDERVWIESSTTHLRQRLVDAQERLLYMRPRFGMHRLP